MDAVTLDLHADVIVGILGRERVNRQRLEARVEMSLDLDACARTGDLDASVDYAAVDEAFRALAGGGFLLIETLALATLRWLLLPPGPGERRAAIERASLHLLKPEVMPRALPGVRLSRSAGLAVERIDLGDGVVARVLASLDEVRALRVEVPEGRRYTPPEGAAVHFGDGQGPCTLLVVEARAHAGLR
jgi:dihydroneopterin aldolase